MLPGSFWNEKLLQEVCAGLAEELQLSPDAPGGMVAFRRTLTLSFFFKFYLTVLQKLGKEHPEDVSGGPGRAQTLCSTFVWAFAKLVWVTQCCEPGGELASFLWTIRGRGARTGDTAQGATQRWEPTGWLRVRALGWRQGHGVLSQLCHYLI